TRQDAEQQLGVLREGAGCRDRRGSRGLGGRRRCVDRDQPIFRPALRQRRFGGGDIRPVRVGDGLWQRRQRQQPAQSRVAALDRGGGGIGQEVRLADQGGVALSYGLCSLNRGEDPGADGDEQQHGKNGGGDARAPRS